MAQSEFGLSDLLDAIRAGGDFVAVRRGVELVLQALIETEATGVIGARHCHCRDRTVSLAD